MTKQFRAWDKVEKVMYTSGLDYQMKILGLNDDGGEGVDTGEEGYEGFGFTDKELKRFEIMDILDLEDKNGIKITQDDVVKFIDDDGSEIIGRVQIFRYQWGLMNDDQFSAFCYQIQTSRTDYHEVLGNIHEHPELQELL